MNAKDVRRKVLRSEIERDWRHIGEHLERAESVEPAAGEAQAALVALSLDHAYQAFETLLLRIERALGAQPRSGAAWHAQLLADATLEIDGVRPAVYPKDAEHHWASLLRFRHFLRHAYAVGLDSAELDRNRAHLRSAVAKTETHLTVLLQALED